MASPKSYTPREPLNERIARLAKDRRMLLVLFGLVVAGRLVLRSYQSYRDGNPLHLILAFLALGAAAAYAAYVIHSDRQAGDQARSALARTIDDLAEFPNLTSAWDTYAILTGEQPPNVGVSGGMPEGRLDAELAFAPAEQREDGTYPLVSPLGAPADASPYVAFSQSMLETFSAEELLAVLLHLKYRGDIARGQSALNANGVCEADSKALLASRDHVAVLSAVQKVAGQRETPLPTLGLVRFADEDLYATDFTSGGLPTKWANRDRVAELREHLGAMALDVLRP